MSKEINAKEKELLTAIKDSFCVFEDFGYNLDEDDDSKVYDIISDTVDKYGVTYARGVSKMCLITPDADWVLKIPFEGSYFCNYDYETKEYDDFDTFETYYGAHIEEDRWNYCAAEVDYYEMAKEEDIAEFFAKTEYFGTCKSTNKKGFLPTYIQEKCIPYNEKEYCKTNIHPSEDSLKKVSSSDKYQYCRFSDDWVALAIDCYGEEKVDALCYFLDLHPEMAGDFHSGNYGYRIDGTPVLIDYTGWDS